MALPELVRRAAEKLLVKYCSGNLPSCSRAHGRLSYRVEGEAFVLVEKREVSQGGGQGRDLPVAQLRFNQELQQWTLHYRDRQGRWIFYPNAPPSLDLGKLVRHLDADPLNFFWE